MNSFKRTLIAAGALAALATGAVTLTSLNAAAPAANTAATEMKMPATLAEHQAEATKLDQEAAKLEAKADRHARMAALYRGLISGGSKQENTYRSIANHCDRLVELYRQAAIENREMAKSHRTMAQAM